MTSSKKAKANRRNSRKSTGPVTARGKEVSARNATRHGFFSEDLLAPGEDANELLDLRRQLIDDLRPQNSMEMILVERIISAQWKLQRLQAAEAAQFAADEAQVREDARRQAHMMSRTLRLKYFEEPDWHMTQEQFVQRRDGFVEVSKTELPAPSLLAQSFGDASSALYRLSIYEQRLERSMFRAMKELQRLRHDVDPSELPASPYAVAAPETQCDSAKTQATARETGAHHNVRNEATAPAQTTQLHAAPKLDAKIVMLKTRAIPEGDALPSLLPLPIPTASKNEDA